MRTLRNALSTALALLLAGPLLASADSGLPWTKASYGVESITPRAGFLEVALRSGEQRRRVVARNTEACQGVFTEGEVVALKERTGPAVRGDLSCDLAGIGDLESWRVSRSLGGYGTSPIQRSSVRIERVHADDDYLYLRGGFSIAGLLAWRPGTDQVVALVPRTERCEGLSSGSFVSVLFKDAGKPALGISAKGGTCPIEIVFGVLPSDFPETPESGPPASPR